MTPIHLPHFFEQALAQPWHQHDERDDCFWVLKGCLGVALPDGVVQVGSGEIFVVPRGVRHHTFSAEGAYVLLFEPIV